MICAYCKSDIEKDSFFCDQCGMELFICPNCNQPRKGKRCSEDGGILFSPRLNSQNQNPVKLNKEIEEKTQTSIESSSMKPILKLMNRNLNIDIEIKDDIIIGRTEGAFAKLFSKFPDISGKHLSFKYVNNGWTIIDIGSDGLGSTYGTKISNSPNWSEVKRLEPNRPVRLEDNSYILLADKYEFYVKIIPYKTSTPTGTMRV